MLSLSSASGLPSTALGGGQFSRGMGERVAPRSTWLQVHADQLVDALGDFGLSLPQPAAAGLLQDRVRAVAGELRITEQSARRYVTDDTVRDIAREIAVSLVEERPGSAPLEHPRTVRTPLATVGRSVAALAEAARLALVNGDPHLAEQAVQLISGLGQMLAEHEETIPAGQSVLLQQPLLARTHRILEGTAGQVRGGEMRLPDDVPPAAAEALADALARDAGAVRTLLDLYGTPTDAPD